MRECIGQPEPFPRSNIIKLLRAFRSSQSHLRSRFFRVLPGASSDMLSDFLTRVRTGRAT
jgi:hypothetical protein